MEFKQIPCADVTILCFEGIMSLAFKFNDQKHNFLVYNLKYHLLHSYDVNYEICKHVIGGSPTHNYRDVIRNALLKIAIPKTDEQCDSTSVSYDIHIEYNIFVNICRYFP